MHNSSHSGTGGSKTGDDTSQNVDSISKLRLSFYPHGMYRRYKTEGFPAQVFDGPNHPEGFLRVHVRWWQKKEDDAATKRQNDEQYGPVRWRARAAFEHHGKCRLYPMSFFLDRRQLRPVFQVQKSNGVVTLATIVLFEGSEKYEWYYRRSGSTLRWPSRGKLIIRLKGQSQKLIGWTE